MEAMAASGQPLPGSTPGASRSGPTAVSQTPVQGVTITVTVMYTGCVTNNFLWYCIYYIIIFVTL